MNTNINEKFESALKSERATESLGQYARELSDTGMKRKEIYNRFLDFWRILQDAGRGQDEAILGDVMDMVSNSLSSDNPYQMNLPE